MEVVGEIHTGMPLQGALNQQKRALGPGHTKEQSTGRSAPALQMSARCLGTRLAKPPHSRVQQGPEQDHWDRSVFFLNLSNHLRS